ncbi:hypothetical protein B7C51_04615 [Paenibacillus larvae subsp. pulvifaciens]|uniref:Uncharacterized protein n=1 Tax=Paenibacillus larvae subsp. pulvifaciens TaxID=1477 RepID=A0A1V0UQ51_9BACL|nr:hypothetical protein [Paenibacillus larvae]ARF67257.1 hypothetical protein B7C51_04615 [Paenibacillus larvae subsp. pulvifaciens]
MNQKANPWVWTEKAESKMPDRKAGTSVPIVCLTEGSTEYFPDQSWINKGYVERFTGGEKVGEDD